MVGVETIHQSIDSFLLLLANQVLAVSRTLANTKSIAAPVTGTQWVSHPRRRLRRGEEQRSSTC